MNYKETIAYLFNVTPVFEHVGASAYKEGLSNTFALDAHFDHPHRAYRTIHVAGTNGKGSCSHTLASILQEAGYRVGLYTSPHLIDFRERIRVNGQPIDEQRVIDFVEQERSFFEPLCPSFFELTTALAFLYFKEQKVDVAVIEVGLGGRLDCTNIITPELSIITNIGYDHTQFLGNTLEKIAYEKAGIIKAGVPVVIGKNQTETRHIFQSVANELHSPITFAQDAPEVTSSESVMTGGRRYDTQSLGSLFGELNGDYQQQNTNTVLAAVKLLSVPHGNFTISQEHIRQGMSHVSANTGLAGRWQTLQERPKVVCDTGHNVDGWTYLSTQIKAQPCKQLRIVFGMVDDKDIDQVMQMLPRNAVYYWTQASTKRAIPAHIVAEKAVSHHLNGQEYANVYQAYQAALADSCPDDFIFVGGSNYIVADLLASSVKDK